MREKRHVALGQFQAAEFFRGFDIANAQSAQQRHWRNVERHHVVMRRDRNDCTGAGVIEEPGKARPDARLSPIPVLREYGNLRVIAAQEPSRSPREKRSRHNAHAICNITAGNEIIEIGTKAGAHAGRFARTRPGDRHGALARHACGFEQQADGDDVLIADVPDLARATDRHQVMDVSARQSRRVRSGECDGLNSVGVDFDRRAGRLTHEKGAGGQVPDGRQPCAESVGMALQNIRCIGAQRFGIQCRYENCSRLRGGVGDPFERAGSEGGPLTAFEQEAADAFGIAKLRQLETLALLVLARDGNNVERAPLAAKDLGDGSAGRRTKGDLRAPAVNKQRLPDRDFVADIDLEGGTQAGAITADKCGRAHRLTGHDLANRPQRRDDVQSPGYFDMHRNVARLRFNRSVAR